MNFLREYWLRRKAWNIGGSEMSIEAPDGWYIPIKRLIVALARMKRNGLVLDTFVIDDIEDKFSVLRVRTVPLDAMDPDSPERMAIMRASEICSDTCDACGCRGATTYEDQGWYRTRCEMHRDTREAVNALTRLAQADIVKARKQMAVSPSYDLEMAIFYQDRMNQFVVDTAR